MQGHRKRQLAFAGHHRNVKRLRGALLSWQAGAALRQGKRAAHRHWTKSAAHRTLRTWRSNALKQQCRKVQEKKVAALPLLYHFP